MASINQHLINSILEEALDHDPRDWDHFLARRCAGDCALSDAVRRLLRLVLDADQTLPAIAHLEEPRPGDLLASRYRVVQRLGSGGMGSVFLADDPDLGLIALKTLRSDLCRDREALSRFRTEVGLARRISHPNVCRVFELFTSGGRPFCAMRYLEGETLASRLSRGLLTASEFIRIARDIAAGLDAMHDLGIVHRDIKPGNIMLTRSDDGEEHSVITDFGLIATEGARTDVEGSFEYMAPEQFREHPVSRASDIYAFGLTLFEMAAGVRPFPAEMLLPAALRRVTEDAPRLSSVAPATRSIWSEMIADALQRDPHRRPASAGLLVARLCEQAASESKARVGSCRLASPPANTRPIQTLRQTGPGPAAFALPATRYTCSHIRSAVAAKR